MQMTLTEAINHLQVYFVRFYGCQKENLFVCILICKSATSTTMLQVFFF